MSDQLQLPTEEEPASILSGPLTVQSLRDSGYTATERALAELIDNSYEADARNVVVVIVQQKAKHSDGQKQASWRAIEIYVADDGNGMGAPELNHGLAFGAGTRTSRKGIGRFGMGLPQASVSQARRIDAWSWQDSYGMAHHTRVDLDDISETKNLSVPWPQAAVNDWQPAPPARDYTPTHEEPGTEIPPFLKEAGLLDEVLTGPGANHGTIIGWSKIDRTSWTTARAVANNVAFFLGRTYRRFLAESDPEAHYDGSRGLTYEELVDNVDLDDAHDTKKTEVLLQPADQSSAGSRRLFIRVVTRNDEDGTLRHHRALDFTADGLMPDTGQVLPNDPEYLLPAQETNLGSWPDAEGQRQEAPFVPHGRPQVVFVQSRKNGDDHYYPVFITTSHVKKEARPEDQAGGNPFGQHAKRNQGLSVMRADRELLLLDSLNEDTDRRFVGIRVDFSPQLDEVFGVTNNKQEATQLSVALKAAKDNDNKPLQELISAGLIIDGTPSASIYPVARAIRQRFRAASKIVRQQQAGTRSTPAKPTNTSPEVKAATEVDRTAPEEELTERERRAIQESNEPDYRPPSQQDLVTDLTEAVSNAHETAEVYDEEAIAAIALMLTQGSGYAFLVELDEESPAFFRTEERIGVPEARGSSKLVWLNMAHPIWQNYLDGLRIDQEQLDKLGEAELRDIISKARGVIVNMLIAWARIELGGTPADRQAANQTRERWGEKARRYITGSDEPSLPSSPNLLDDLFD